MMVPALNFKHETVSKKTKNVKVIIISKPTKNPVLFGFQNYFLFPTWVLEFGPRLQIGCEAKNNAWKKLRVPSKEKL